MHRNTQHILKKVGVLSVCIVLIIQLGSYAVAQQGAGEIRSTNQNKFLYESAKDQSLAPIGVAIGTGIGTRFDSKDYNQTTSYGEVVEIGTTNSESRQIREDMIAENMVIIKEYLSLLKTDILPLLDSSNTRRNTLNTLISQLEIRYKNATLSMINLQNQKNLLLADIEKIQAEIGTTKTKMSSDFSQSNSTETVKDVDVYLELRRKYNNNFTDIVFINQFLAQYDFLNNYNKRLLDTLINNKEALINKSFVVVPDSGDEFLLDLQLLYEEEEFKRLTR